MLQEMNHIRNIIFDLGGVILNIEIFKGLEAMEKIGIRDIEGTK